MRVTGSTGSRPRRVVVISASIGAGHDGAARELVRGLRAAGYEVDLHDFLDLIGSAFGRFLRGLYATELKVAPRTWGWLLHGLERNPRLTAGTGRVFSWRAARRTSEVVPADTVAIVTTYPLAAQALGALRRAGRLSVPVATFLTDMSVHPLWVAEGIDLHLALHDVAGAQARRLGAPWVVRCRPAVDPAFHAASDVLAPDVLAPDGLTSDGLASADGGEAQGVAERAATRSRYGLPESAPLALVVAGSWGVGEVAEAAAEVAATGLAMPITVCGRNDALRERLVRDGTGIALGWVDDMPALIRACDVVVQNAGGLTSLEAMACRAPVISYRCLPGHGTTNAEALDEAKLAPWVREPAELPEALRTALRAAESVPAVEELFAAPPAVEVIRDLVEPAATPMAEAQR